MSRSCRSFEEFVDDLDKYRYIWDYSLFLREWLDAFGHQSINACVFDKQAFYNGDLISDFSQKIGIPANIGGKKLKNKKNISPGFEELEIIRQKNIAQRGSNSNDQSTGFGPQSVIDPAAYEARVTRLTSASNAWVNENILTSQKVKLPVG